MVGDAVVEPDEAFSVNLSAATGAMIADATGVDTIVNDDSPPPTLSINDVTLAEGNSGGTVFGFIITRTGNLAAASSVSFSTSNGTAVHGSDYNGVQGVVVFGGSSTTIFITVNGDTAVEADETFTVNLSNATGATIVDGTGVATIINDDVVGTPPTLLGIVIGDGVQQRSQVKKATLTFDRPVALDASALRLDRLNSGGSGADNGSAPTNASAALGTPSTPDDGHTWVVPFAGAGEFLERTGVGLPTGSLVDGIYKLFAPASAALANGIPMATPSPRPSTASSATQTGISR